MQINMEIYPVLFAYNIQRWEINCADAALRRGQQQNNGRTAAAKLRQDHENSGKNSENLYALEIYMNFDYPQPFVYALFRDKDAESITFLHQ